ncbi:MAG: HNH endonuclease, partial [Alphaproteobacteria bacterium]|nr:HNH endonuclease [Alphaproteobacteria bacterium]
AASGGHSCGCPLGPPLDTEASQPQLPRSGPNGQPTESSHLVPKWPFHRRGLDRRFPDGRTLLIIGGTSGAQVSAYDECCAITGLKLINGGGRAEVDAAHIRPVQASGPDILCNGLAFSGAAHWMFDRGLISLEDGLKILISRHVNDSDVVRGFINKTGFAFAPKRRGDQPHPHFLSWHRENCFKN